LSDITADALFDAADEVGEVLELQPGDGFAVTVNTATTFTGTISLERCLTGPAGSFFASATYTAVAEDDGIARVRQWVRLYATVVSAGSIHGQIKRGRPRQ